ncbi:AbrB/MazE/SpoVT family DNA-binding domain-containing protein [Candidatus Woesearchaeota archaeon]|nr:AbrB/MazE/SpoVT family DNA-binding domain-containing protein [Candidatus Woesearchaeota archaeon]
MKRKLIKQGQGGFTVTVPITWVRDNNLDAGSEITLKVNEDFLMIKPEHIKLKKKELEIKVDITRESAVRTVLANAYREGFDKIILTYKGKEDIVINIVKELLVGFEVLQKKEEKYIIESVAEPSYDDFEKIIQRQFFILLNIIDNVGKEEIKNDVEQFQKYDNFLKRSISKRGITLEATSSLWQFLSNLTQIARQCYHLNKLLREKKTILSKKEEEFMVQIREMVRVLQKAYLTKEINHLMGLHSMEQNLVYQIGPSLLKENPTEMHYLISLARVVYLANSPLMGFIIKQNNSASKNSSP